MTMKSTPGHKFNLTKGGRKVEPFVKTLTPDTKKEFNVLTGRQQKAISHQTINVP
jgi:hypothetical protein